MLNLPPKRKFALLILFCGCYFFLYRWVSITDSLVKVDDTVYANVRAYLSSDIPAGGENGMLEVRIADYSGSSGYGSLYPQEDYPVSSSVFWTSNALMWYYDGTLAGGTLYSNSSDSDTSLFTVKSRYNMSLSADSANFYLSQTMNGAAGVDSTARATYDMATGMLADIGGEVYYANKLLFGYNTNYDLQLQDGTNPDYTSSPTVAPTATVHPSRSPTARPSVPGATNFPTVVPTRAPTTGGQTSLPTAKPTAAPSFALVQFSAAQVIL